jgi:hypothetical protein
MTPSPIPVILGIDVEPDPREIDPSRRSPWRGYEQCEGLLADWRTRIERATSKPARYSWFFRMDPQVAVGYGSPTWAVDHYARQVRDSLQHGDEIGLHPHAWRWDNRQRVWIDDRGNADWVEQCVSVSLDAYRAAFGRPCRSLRYGDRFMSTRLARYIEAQGIEYDLTVEPGEAPRPSLVPTEHYTGSIPDYRAAPRAPYRPAPDDFLTRDSDRTRGMWMIPLSSAPTWPSFPKLRSKSRNAEPLPCKKEIQYTSLRLWHPPREFRRIAGRILAASTRPYIAVVIRSELSLHRSVAYAQQNLEFLLKHPLASRFQFCTPAEMMAVRGA